MGRSVVSADLVILLYILAYFAPSPSSVDLSYAVGAFFNFGFPLACECQRRFVEEIY